MHRIVYWFARKDPTALLALMEALASGARHRPWLQTLLAPQSELHNCWFVAFQWHYPQELVRLYEYDYAVRQRATRLRNNVERQVAQAISYAYPTDRDAEARAPGLHQAGVAQVPGCRLLGHMAANGHALRVTRPCFYRPWQYTTNGPSFGTHSCHHSEEAWSVGLIKMRRAALLIFNAWAQATAQHMERLEIHDAVVYHREQAASVSAIPHQANMIINAARKYAEQLEPALNAVPASADTGVWDLERLMPGHSVQKRLAHLGQQSYMTDYAPLEQAWWRQTLESVALRVDTEIPFPATDALGPHLQQSEATLRIDPLTHGFAYEPGTNALFHRLVAERDGVLCMES